MKLKQLLTGATVAAVTAMAAATTTFASTDYPSLPVTISGTLKYTPNYSSITGVPIKTMTFTVQSLIDLLNASPSVTNTLFQVTGKTKIPAGSYFYWNPDEDALIITNKNGFSFTLTGSYSDVSGSVSYNYGYLYLDTVVGTWTDSAKGGSETDVASFYFYFNDQASNRNEIEMYGTATLTWNYGAEKNNSLKATLILSMSGGGSDYCEVDGYDAVGTSFTASGTGSGTEQTYSTPFYWEW